MEEIWKDIEGYDGYYQISNFGRVKSFKGKDVRYLKLSIDHGGYYNFTMKKNNNKRKHGYIHRLVWDHFGDSKRNGVTLQVDHLDNNKLNNRIDNLQLLSNRENTSKAYLTTNKTSKYTGVSWYKRDKCWRSYIQINGKLKWLGSFKTEHEAHLAYQKVLESI